MEMETAGRPPGCESAGVVLHARRHPRERANRRRWTCARSTGSQEDTHGESPQERGERLGQGRRERIGWERRRLNASPHPRAYRNFLHTYACHAPQPLVKSRHLALTAQQCGCVTRDLTGTLARFGAKVDFSRHRTANRASASRAFCSPLFAGARPNGKRIAPVPKLPHPSSPRHRGKRTGEACQTASPAAWPRA